ncbi:MAG: PAS domain S-box protein [Anaerolineae bacterium]|nr:PAS domain S-box protein [Anaerolineae bacterium]
MGRKQQHHSNSTQGVPLREHPQPHYQRLLESAGYVWFRAACDGVVTDIDATAEHLFGWSRDEFVGRTLCEMVHSDWQSRVHIFYLNQLEENIPETTFEFPIRTASGQYRWVEQIVHLNPEDPTVPFEGIIRDITRRHQATERLDVMSHVSWSLIEQSGNLIAVTDTEGRYVFANSDYLDWLGCSLQDILGKSDLELGMVGMPRFHALTMQVMTSGAMRIIEENLHYKGLPRSFTIIKHPMRSPAGLVTGAVTIMRDISARKQAEDALRQSEERYRIIVEQQKELISRWTSDTRLTFVNDAYCRAFGQTREQLIGTSYLDLVPPELHAQMHQQIEESIRSRVPIHYEHPVIAPDGELHWQEWTDVPIFDAQGNFVEFQSSGRDVTRRRLAEIDRSDYIQRLEVIQQVDIELTRSLDIDYVLDIALSAAVSISRADAGAIHLLENDQLRVARVIGDYPDGLVGTVIPLTTGLIGRAARRKEAELVFDVMSDPDYVPNVAHIQAQMTMPLIAQDRLIGTINVQTSEPGRFTPQMFDFLKLLAARIASALDNARLHRTTESQLAELQSLYQQVSNLEQLKTQMIRIAAHDLRNPLGVINGYLQLIRGEQEPVSDPRLLDYVDIMKDSVTRIDKITRDILTLERVSAGRTSMDEDIDMTKLALDAVQTSRIQATRKSQDLQVELPPKAVYVRGDRFLLPETAVNLINNAIKYTPDGGRIIVRLWTEGDQVIFTVEDNGVGIPEDRQVGLFQPFYRVQLKETRAIKGTGLGLHLVRTIIEQHGGHVRFQSSYGQGSTFGFDLPRVTVAASNGRSRRRAAHG